MIHYPSPNHEPRPDGAAVDMLILHYTGMPSADDALARLCDPAAKVSAHYLIDEDGQVFHLVDENRRAWHAGKSAWRGQSDVNGHSIGIELVNPGHEFGYRSFPEPQMAALIALAKDILARHPIPARNVVGHADVAPTRKQDPGELFDWARLARQGIGLWPEDFPLVATASPHRLRRLLSSFGYPVESTGAPTPELAAFQRHFRQNRCDGEPDAETTTLLIALCRQISTTEG